MGCNAAWSSLVGCRGSVGTVEPLAGCTRDQLRSAFAGYRLGERDPDRGGQSGQRGSDLAEAPTRIAQADAGQRAYKLVVADVNDQIEGTQMLSGDLHDASEQLLAGAGTLAIYEGRCCGHIDIGQDERVAGLPAAIQLVGKVGQARLLSACTGQRAARDLPRERLAVKAGALALIGGLLAILCGGVAVLGGQRAQIGRLRALPRRTLALRGAADDAVAACQRARLFVVLHGGLELRPREIARVGGTIARVRRQITSLRDLIALISGVQTRPRGLACRTFANVAGELELRTVGVRAQGAIAGAALIVAASHVVAVGADLIAASARLINVCEQLLAARPGAIDIRQDPVESSQRRILPRRPRH